MWLMLHLTTFRYSMTRRGSFFFIGGPGHDPGYFWLPAGVYVDEKDRVYIVDSYNRRVQVFQYLSERWKKKIPRSIRNI